jgi:hypothetical protein
VWVAVTPTDVVPSFQFHPYSAIVPSGYSVADAWTL